VGAPLQSLPAGWQLVPLPAAYTFNGQIAISAFDPKTGQFHALASVPRDCFYSDDNAQPADGSLWITCGGSMVISHDRGVSWQRVLQLGKDSGTDIYPTSIDGILGYAYVTKGKPAAKQLYKTTNGGRNWQLVRNVSLNGDLQLLADGSLVYSDVGPPPKLFRSTDEGASFAPLDPSGPNSGISRTVVGAYVTNRVVGNQYIPYVSDDGRGFVPVPSPHN
jgi:photosystem II stability/assembly factor-like uncharacterized protein